MTRTFDDEWNTYVQSRAKRVMAEFDRFPKPVREAVANAVRTTRAQEYAVYRLSEGVKPKEVARRIQQLF